MSSVQQNVIKHKVGLLNLAAELGNVSRACKVMGFSHDTFYRYQAERETGGVDALIDANCRKPNPKNRVEEAAEAAVTAFALEQPAFGQRHVSNELRRRGIFVSASGVRSVWLRHISTNIATSSSVSFFASNIFSASLLATTNSQRGSQHSSPLSQPFCGGINVNRL